MAGTSSSQPVADRNLLFGILALQMDFVSRDALITAMNAWVLQKSESLGQLLCAQGELSAERCVLLEALVQEHLKQHQNDPQQSLAALSSVGSARDDLAQIADVEVQASLARVSAAKPANDPWATSPAAVGTPTSTGLRFRFLRPHARGGLGQVSVALDEELHREVALKEIQDQHADNPDSRSRFLVEAEITGGLEHPGIVPVYGLGSYADGRPYYAMRFIRGDSLNEALQRFHRAVGRSGGVGERTVAFRKLLGRLIDVCNAIAYAHSRGVLHRDLKPGNIMLGKYGETLVVDWGLAKPLDQAERTEDSEEGRLKPSLASGSALTQAGSAVGTPQFMSPEQAAGRLDQLNPASDVYSLGATLYALLTGQSPFPQSEVADVLRFVQRGEFTPPRRVNRDVPPALEAICVKAMALKPMDRYASPRALADDLEHWLADEPVSAFREPLRVRLARWGRRHKPVVTGAAVLLVTAVAALSTGLVLLGRKQAEIVQERNAARVAKSQAEAINKFLVEDLLAAARPENLGKDVPMRKVLDRAAQKVDALADEPEVEAAVRLAIGDSYLSLGLYKEAEPHLRRAVELRREQLGPDHADTLKAIDRLGVLRVQQGRYDDAEQLLRNNLEDRRRVSGSEHPETLRAMANLYWLLEVRDKLDEAEPLFRECLQTRRRVLGPEHEDTLTSLSDWAWFHYRKGKSTEAESLNRECLEIRRRVLGPEHPDTLMSMHNLALALKDWQKAKEAESLLRESLAIGRRVLGPEHLTTLYSMSDLALLLWEQGKLDEAEKLIRQTLEIQTRVCGLDQKDTLTTMSNLAVLLRDRGQWDEAEKLHRQTLETRRRILGPEHSDTLFAMSNLARVLHDRGKRDEAEKLYRQTLELEPRILGSEHHETLTTTSNLASLLHELGKWDEAERMQRRAFEGRRRVLGAEHVDTLYSMESLALVLEDRGKFEEAEKVLRDKLALQRKLLPAGDKDLGQTLASLGAILLKKDAARAAEPVLRECLDLRQKALPKGDWRTANARSLLGGCLTALTRYDSAEPLLLSGYEALKAANSAPPQFVRETLDRIIKLYEDWQKPEKAATWRAERTRLEKSGRK